MAQSNARDNDVTRGTLINKKLGLVGYFLTALVLVEASKFLILCSLRAM